MKNLCPLLNFTRQSRWFLERGYDDRHLVLGSSTAMTRQLQGMLRTPALGARKEARINEDKEKDLASYRSDILEVYSDD